jgi:hypothetical protein
LLDLPSEDDLEELVVARPSAHDYINGVVLANGWCHRQPPGESVNALAKA